MELSVLQWEGERVSAFDMEQEEWIEVKCSMPGVAPESACYIYSTEGVFVCGGWRGTTSSRVYRLDRPTPTLSPTPMLQSRMDFCGVPLPKAILVFGGFNRESELCLSTCERYSLETNRWTPLPSMQWERRAASACVVGEGVYVLGGVGISQVEILSLPELKWFEADFSLPSVLSNAGLFLLSSQTLLLLGGRLEDGSLTSAVYKVELDSDTLVADTALEKGFAVSQPCAAYAGKLVLFSGGSFLIYTLTPHLRRVQRHSTDPGKTQIRLGEAIPPQLSRELASKGIMGLEKGTPEISITLPERPLIFIVKRPGRDDDVDKAFHSMIADLLQLHIRVLVEPSSLPSLPSEVSAFDLKLHSDKINLLVTLGGDGTVIWAVGLFKTEPLPPVLAIHMGSLGFMTYYSVEEGMEILRKAIRQEELGIELKKRLDIWYTTHSGKRSHKGTALNEVVIDRGSSASLLHVDCYMNGDFFTTAFADGIMIATPAGSTAYSLAAGGSIVHHEIPSVLFTPICPHSLSFRPILFPEKVILSFVVPEDARCSGMVSIDGHSRFELPKKATLEVVISCYPVPFISESKGIGHWMQQLKSTMKWNKRKKQKPFEGKNGVVTVA